MDLCILKKVQTNGERMVRGVNGRRNGGNPMVPLAKLRNVRISGAASTQTHPLRLDMRMSGMKGTKL